MQPHVACEPPLGQVTVVGTNVVFLASLSFGGAPLRHDDQSHNNWASASVAIWHNAHDGGKWGELVLEKVAGSHQDCSHGFAQYFTGILAKPNDGPQVISFTLKFKVHDNDWQWLNDIDQLGNGLILYQVEDAKKSDLSACFDHLNPAWACTSIDDAKDNVTLWSLEHEVTAARGNDSGWSYTHLGLPKTSLRWFAIVRHSTPWLGPRQGDGPFNTDKDAILASFLRTDGLHLVILAMNGLPHISTTLGHNGEGHVMVTSRNDGLEAASMQVLVAIGTSFEAANGAIMDHARNLVSAQNVESGKHTDEGSLERWYDGLSYCTWNGLGQNLSEEKILNALSSLAENNIDISTLIIDDNWQSLDFRGDSNFEFRWTDFEANEENFPGGLKQTICRLRKNHSHIKHIAVWHGIFGYWGGISPSGAIAKKYKVEEVLKQTQESYLPDGHLTTIAATDVPRLYDDFYGFLASSGVDSVKADVQFLPDYLADATARRDMIYSYQDAWVAASQKHFSGRAISCMSQTPQIMFHSLLPQNKPRYMVRNSDDFFPNAPSSHTWHIFCNAHNALFTQHLNILPDWDMFQTAHEFASMHAAARCLSGGPIYFTDVPGQHDLGVIHSMTAKATDGRVIILRPETAGVTMEQYVKPQSSRFLRIGTTHQNASLLGVFNIGDRSRVELVKLGSFRNISAGQKHVVRKHTNGQILGPFGLDDTISVVSVELDPTRCEILTACPIQTHKGVDVAVLGLLEKFSGAAAVRSVDFAADPNSNATILSVSMKAVGTLGIYVQVVKKHLKTGSIDATLQIGKQTTAIDITNTEDSVLELDLEVAWAKIRDSTNNPGDALVRIRIQTA